MKRLILAGATAVVFGSGANASDLAGIQIRELLAGNSIVHPAFGCVYFNPDGSTLAVAGGQSLAGFWRVEGDLYRSSGNCGSLGCRLSGGFPSTVFRRIDGGYVQPATVVRGNHCEKNVLVS